MEVIERKQAVKYGVTKTSSSLSESPHIKKSMLLACWPLAPKLAGSNPAEAVGFLRA